MDALEADLYEDLAQDEAEGAAAMDEELGMEDLGDEFEDEFDEGAEAEDYADEEALFDEDSDSLESADAYEEEAGFESESGSEDDFDEAMAFALGAEDSDEFFRRLMGAVRRAAPMIGRIAGGVSQVARLIPIPAAQAIGTAANLVSRGANLVQQLRAEGASEEEALDAFAEFAARNPRARPIAAAVAARAVLRPRGARLPQAVRRQAVRHMRGAATILVRRRGPLAVRALPRIVRSVRHNIVARRASPLTALRVVRRTAARVAASPVLIRRLARPSVVGRRRLVRLYRRYGAYGGYGGHGAYGGGVPGVYGGGVPGARPGSITIPRGARVTIHVR